MLHIKQVKKLSFKSLRRFGGGHLKEYDWRDDPHENQDLYQNQRRSGPDPTQYTTPYSSEPDTWFFPQFAPNFSHSDLTHRLMPENRLCVGDSSDISYPYWDPEADVAHEYDYESEDYDYQAESFSLQHFRKKGPISQWIFVGFFPLIFFWNEFINQHNPDEDYYRLKRPPPLEYPDSEDTDDLVTYEDYNSFEGKKFRDTGLVHDLWFDIIDGKKVYKKFAGVNQPMELI